MDDDPGGSLVTFHDGTPASSSSKQTVDCEDIFNVPDVSEVLTDQQLRETYSIV